MQTRNLLRLKGNLILGLVVIIVASNLLLAIKLHNTQQTIILVPTIDRQLKVGSNFVSKDYLKLRAEQIVYLLFSMKNENLNQVMQELLKQVDNSSHKEFKSQLEKLGEDIKARGYYYSFADIKEWEVNEESLTVQVSGYLETYLSGRQIARQLKNYKLTFCNKAGLVNLNSFEEIKTEGDHESNN